MQTAPTRVDPSVEETRRILVIFAGLLVAMLLSSLDQLIFSTALPTIVGELSGVEQMLWVTTAYVLAATIMMPVYGKLGDLIGRKYLFMGALALFLAGSVLGGLAGSMPWLIAARAVQGLGGGGLMILSQAIVADVVPLRERARYMGMIGAVFALSSVAGPLLGGWFTEGIGWRWAFWFNVPLGLLALLAAWRFLPHTRPSQRPRLDVWGFVTMAIAVTALILFTSLGGNTYAWASPPILGLGALALLAAVAFVMIEQRVAEPIIPLHLFRNRSFNLATIVAMTLAVAMFGAVAYFPTYLQMVHGYNATVAGLLMVPMVMGAMVSTVTAGNLISKTGQYKGILLACPAIATIGLLLLSTLNVTTSIWMISLFLFIFGVGIGLGVQNLVLVVQSAFPAREVGTATAATNFFREIGASLGAAVVGSFFTTRLVSLLAERFPDGATTPVDVASLTPQVLRSLPDALRLPIASAYNDALVPVFLLLIPMMLIGLVLLLFVEEIPLTGTLETDAAGSQTPDDSSRTSIEGLPAA
ncbi:MAG: MFS transporter [Chloroflexota bacterium]|nr:MFS transporter [Chloroflexota bacterium]